ncbi:MAG: hypothetical protein ACREMB_27065 [Candidatus Rokuibacteriota bacterium]
MENPRIVHRGLLAVFGVLSVGMLGLAAYHRRADVALAWLGAVGALSVGFAVVTLVHLAIFAPLFWLIARLGNRRRAGRGHRSKDDAA